MVQIQNTNIFNYITNEKSSNPVKSNRRHNMSGNFHIMLKESIIIVCP